VLDKPRESNGCYIAKFDDPYLFDIADLLHAYSGLRKG
jgi:hypothetical protein